MRFMLLPQLDWTEEDADQGADATIGRFQVFQPG